MMWWEDTANEGTFLNEHTFSPTLDFLETLSSGDLDGDGDTDILAAYPYSNLITWWQNPLIS